MKVLSFVLGMTMVLPAVAGKLTDYQPYQFETLFTNPVCAEYAYPTPMLANDGTTLLAKPRNVYCKSADFEASASRSISPQFRLLEWAADPLVTEIFFAYLSFSNKDLADTLCAAAGRGVKLTMVLDAKPEEEETGIRLAENLKECGEDVTIHYRGNREGLGYAHNKVFMVNPDDPITFKMVFSSGNASPGTAIYHENWNFVTTSQLTHFAQAHKCLREGLINHGDSKAMFVEFMAGCRAAISTPEEDDIHSFFVPGEGQKALAAIREMGLRSSRIQAAAHRFSGVFVKLFTEFLAADKDVRLITDDDMYWSWKLHKDVGRNMRVEAYKVHDLIAQGLNLRYMETNVNYMHLQHNKYVIFEMRDHDAVFAGAGNFTSSAFDHNFENFYVITNDDAVNAFETQYVKFWGQMATSLEKLPTQYVMP